MTQTNAAVQAPQTDLALRDDLPADLQRLVDENLGQGETVEIQLKGSFKELLVCTETRVMILKAGFMTGQGFGTNNFQFPYAGISGAEVKFGVIDGYFELIAGGVQTQEKSLWAKDPAQDPSQSPNCIAFVGRHSAERFRQACAAILDRVAAPANT